MTDPDPDSTGQQPPMPPQWEPPPWARTTAQTPWTGSGQSTGQPPPWPDPRVSGWNPGSQGWPYPGAWGYPAFAPAHRNAPMAVLAGVVLAITGALITLFSLLFLAVGVGGGELMAQLAIEAGMEGAGDALATVLAVISIFFLVIGLLQLLAAVGVFRHREWARWLGVALAAMGIAFGAMSVLGNTMEPVADAGTWTFTILWTGAYVVALVGLLVSGEHFRHNPPRPY